MTNHVADARPRAATKWLPVIVLVGAGVVAALHIGKAPGALPVIKRELGLSLPMSGLVISGFNLLGAVVGVGVGALADRLGHRRGAVGGLVGLAAASAAGAVAPGAAPLLASRLAEGMAFMVVVSAIPGMLPRLASSRDLALVMGCWSGYMPLGAALMLLGTTPAVSAVGWRGTWLAVAAATLAWASVVFVASRGIDHPAPRDRTSRSSPRSGLSRDALVLSVAFAAYSAQILSILGFLPTFLVEQEGLGSGAAAALTAVAFLINVPGAVLGGAIQRRGIPRWWLLVWPNLLMVMFTAAFYTESLPLAVRYAACLLMTLVGGVVPAAILGAIPSVSPSTDEMGTTTGLVMQGANAGQFLGPPAVAAVAAAAASWSFTPAITALFAATAATCGLLLRRS